MKALNIIKKNKDWTLSLIRDIPPVRNHMTYEAYLKSEKVLGFIYGNTGCRIYKNGVMNIYWKSEMTKDGGRYFLKIKNKKAYLNKINKLAQKRIIETKKFFGENKNIDQISDQKELVKVFVSAHKHFVDLWYLQTFPVLIEAALKSIGRNDVFQKYQEDIMKIRFLTQDIALAQEQYIDKLAAEMAKAKGLKPECLLYSLPDEIVNDKISCKISHQRFKSSLAYVAGNKIFFNHNVREVAEVQKYLDRVIKKHTSNEIKGKVAYPGQVSGRVKLVMLKSELKEIKKGEILVTPMTEIDYIPYLSKVKAIITNEGGITCHAAIISREMKIPCIIGTGNATRILKTGYLVEVDAKMGSVKIIR